MRTHMYTYTRNSLPLHSSSGSRGRDSRRITQLSTIELYYSTPCSISKQFPVSSIYKYPTSPSKEAVFPRKDGSSLLGKVEGLSSSLLPTSPLKSFSLRIRLFKQLGNTCGFLNDRSHCHTLSWQKPVKNTRQALSGPCALRESPGVTSRDLRATRAWVESWFCHCLTLGRARNDSKPVSSLVNQRWQEYLLHRAAVRI